MLLRRNGISTLIACQNEEATVGASILSFLRFSDEVIVVDNGSSDLTKEICVSLQQRFPEQVKFFDRPDIARLEDNRQCALEQSAYRWIFRGDADFICYDEGDYDCRIFREYLLKCNWITAPFIWWTTYPAVHGDLWHTGPDTAGGLKVKLQGPKYMLPVASMPRMYKWVPGLKFGVNGRSEGVVWPDYIPKRVLRKRMWPQPFFMECDVKSEWSYLLRSERSNWREESDYERYPTLESYIAPKVRRLYATEDLKTAAYRYVEDFVLPRLVEYDVEQNYPYPRLARQMMKSNPVYRVVEEGKGKRTRRYFGVRRVALEEGIEAYKRKPEVRS